MLGGPLAADNVRTFGNSKWRHFMMCGYILVLHSIDSIGFPGDIPHYCGIMGNFTVSGIFHEYCMRCTYLAMSMGKFPSINLFIMCVR
ncbi:hypothetical protein E3P81_02403 [Wallemia ichthyophaga]|nr:hypothetical protein E3P85_02127 [Wallemia ichthyophaga]TIB46025.1 hypothetical protein E3P82_02403 [Wallemia ichthyophaga]TIB49765.1 hypothetical protein E3P81_02403 [Wallemia ichthyophaga]TIB52875.1 hypothetical protein E3P80_02404 [Wallemia ichthyophaga]TIB58220.1 hypothetical protein E3P79_02402 [Wallemia ichthyophaga]